jgi:hypothetical protein
LKRSREVYKAKSKIADERSCVDVKRGVRERTEEDIADGGRTSKIADNMVRKAIKRQPTT